jgi:predicted nuclease with TOPRIM domain
MSDYDPTDFVDNDFQAHKAPRAMTATGAGGPQRAPTREEVDSRVVEAQQKLAELKRAQEELERERSTLEETRRRQMEFQTSRQELIHSLTRGLGLLEETEFNARRDAEQMAKALADLRDALSKIEAIHEETWTKDNFNVELTRALTVIENARMEWNSSRLKFPVLSGQIPAEPQTAADTPPAREQPLLAQRGFFGLCKVGLALTWPVVLAVLAALGVFLALWFSR